MAEGGSAAATGSGATGWLRELHGNTVNGPVAVQVGSHLSQHSHFHLPPPQLDLNEQSSWKSFHDLATEIKAELLRGWLSTPPGSLSDPVPPAVAEVDTRVMALGDRLRDLTIAAPSGVLDAAQKLHSAMRDAADVQFSLNLHNCGSNRRLADLDEVAFELHTQNMHEALDSFATEARKARPDTEA